MGVLEEKIKRKTRIKNLEKIILGTVATAGLLSVALLAPNALQALKLLGWKPHRRQREYKLPHPKCWDKKWRVLIFDIPEKRKYLREKIRNTLGAIGFSQLQKSVWVYPYDCEDLIALLKADFKVGKDVLYVIADKIEYDAPLRAKFGLKR